MGYALGCVRLSLDDFCGLTPGEFASVARAHADLEESRHRDDWERMRMLAAMTMQPHVKNKLRPQTLLPFPWEHGRNGGSRAAERVSVEEAKRRRKELMERLGKT